MSAGSGVAASIGAACSGLTPQVTVGATSRASKDSSASNSASSSLRSARQSSTARSNPSPLGAKARPRRKAKVVSSGAISPSRAPASIERLQSVMRPSIDKARTASPAYSIAWPCAPSAPMRAMRLSARSLADRPAPSAPSIMMRMRFGRFCQSVWVIRTCAASDAPMPKA